MQLREGREPIEKPEYMCDATMRPHKDNNCHVPCVGDCVTAEWSSWSSCQPVGNSGRKYTRHNTILQHMAYTNVPGLFMTQKNFK